ncbi:ribonucleoside-diphosphate reductase alpha chain [Mycoplasmoides fastidiosum]|uniref:Ribonucleoside-diphosphate reductase n=1 Tax=Mycoplasmoides fastidiosum TaxID=92758 RepID=A0ABU0LYJ8_9BACT|nr:class 1b ribonucleoside-diphosphate reductase subunit alpha [Mycoplasmoides fastidiosum]MDQ0513755.1 ribonucleoside-diphosphate reductase alpha chain [Mycoplasmoides fastidiosum]UUD37824.1 class 1b ribonucleoside-diphosphate reductase subunit alpha [Mycoplasmoides fastidiosum]
MEKSSANKQSSKYIEYNNLLNRRKEDGFFDLEKDQLAIKEYQKSIQDLSINHGGPIENIQWLIEHNYYSDFLRDYNHDDVKRLVEKIRSYNFSFTSYMAISKFYESYALKTDDRKYFLENYEDRIIAVALDLAGGDFQFAWDLAVSMIEQRYQPATPTFLNAGKKRKGGLVSCFLLEVDDSLNSINFIISNAMQLSKIGGGVAINLSKLRARGAEILKIKNSASGVMPVLKILENVFSYANQLGQRPGAGAAYLNIFHYDLKEFLDCKKINADEKSRIQTLSIGLIIPNKFFELAEKNQPFYIFEPYTIYKKYHKHLDDLDMDLWYDKLVADDDIIKSKEDPRNILVQISKTQFESGYPYIMYKDNANRVNPLKELGQIKMSNLCTEIFQIQTTSKINDYGMEDEIGYDVSCNLGSLNINNLMELKNIEESVDIAMRALTRVSDISDISNSPGVRKANSELHSVGLGAMNLAGWLAKKKIAYEDPIAIEFSSVLFAAINFYSIKSSCKIAKERKQTFKGFEKSEYANGKYFDRYLNNSYLPRSLKIIEMFEGIKLPTVKDWEELKTEVVKYGLYNAYRLAIAPTQSISYIQSSTASIQPIIDTIETRMYGDSLTYYPMPFLSKDNALFYKSAYNINQFKIIDLISEIQTHIDQGISTILYVTNQTSTRELARLYIYAWKKGLKSLYYTRTKNLEVNECLACAV